jgi:hypothetical protein
MWPKLVLVGRISNAKRSKDISPTHKWTEGRAPVWRPEFTSQDAALQGDPAETAATPNTKLWGSVVVVVASYRFLSQSSF